MHRNPPSHPTSPSPPRPGQTLLQAVMDGDINQVKRCWQTAAAKQYRDVSGRTVLLLAAGKGQLALVQWLLREGGASIQERDADGQTVLLYAAGNGHLALVQWLLREGGASIAKQNKGDQTALLYAAGRGCLALVQWLLREGGASIADKSKYGSTALLSAAREGHLALVQWLLAKGGASLDEKTEKGQDACQLVGGYYRGGNPLVRGVKSLQVFVQALASQGEATVNRSALKTLPKDLKGHVAGYLVGNGRELFTTLHEDYARWRSAGAVDSRPLPVPGLLSFLKPPVSAVARSHVSGEQVVAPADHNPHETAGGDSAASLNNTPKPVLPAVALPSSASAQVLNRPGLFSNGSASGGAATPSRSSLPASSSS